MPRLEHESSGEEQGQGQPDEELRFRENVEASGPVLDSEGQEEEELQEDEEPEEDEEETEDERERRVHELLSTAELEAVVKGLTDLRWLIERGALVGLNRSDLAKLWRQACRTTVNAINRRNDSQNRPLEPDISLPELPRLPSLLSRRGASQSVYNKDVFKQIHADIRGPIEIIKQSPGSHVTVREITYYSTYRRHWEQAERALSEQRGLSASGSTPDEATERSIDIAEE